MNVYLGLVLVAVGGLLFLFMVEVLVDAWTGGECPQFMDVNRVYDWDQEQEPSCRPTDQAMRHWFHEKTNRG